MIARRAWCISLIGGRLLVHWCRRAHNIFLSQSLDLYKYIYICVVAEEIVGT